MTKLPSEREWVFGLFDSMLEEPDDQQRLVFVFRHPVLLSADAQRLLQESGRDDRMLFMLDSFRRRLWDEPERYPRGLGPLDSLLEGLRDRSLTMAAARAQAVQPATAGLLSNTYVKVLFEPLVKEVWDGKAYAAQAAEVVLDSAFAMPFPNLGIHPRVGAVRGFVLVVHAALTKNPDGHLLERAHDVGAWLLQALPWPPERRGDFLHELGVMDLDAYASQWPAGPGYLDEIRPWLARAVHPMPEPAVALSRASRLLAKAGDLRAGSEEAGETWKALLQARIFEASARGAEPDRAELKSIASRALAHFAARPDSDAAQWVARAVDAYHLA
ncbi:MAG: hypothetical protein IT180_03135 [Acidobacteria bacterium]|nr:hypothetical protein [Acidobacteriota bacterium]